MGTRALEGECIPSRHRLHRAPRLPPNTSWRRRPLLSFFPVPQVDAEKRTLIRALPHTLVLHLKRFEWDYETYQRWKVGPCRASPCLAVPAGCVVQ